nr:Swt1 family HEPN domain-containing protein [Solirubrobacterales bacterium]
NRDRIGKMFGILAPELDRFIAGAVEPELEDGVTWEKLVALKDAKKGKPGGEYERLDPQVQLRFLTENVPHKIKPGWYPFDDQLSPTQRSFASELRDARNSWAHNKSYSDDDAYRTLDTAERFLRGIGSAEAGDKVRGLRLEVRRVASDKDDRRVLKDSAVMPESEGLKPWREVLQPHDDVASGNFRAAEFAADLYKVSVTDPEAGKDYSDPVEFFARTYLTEGLQDLVSRTVKRLAGDENAAPVINLQTNFGGGKTHSMLALWHLAAGLDATDYVQEVQELLEETGYGEIPADVNRVALVGNHLSTSGATKEDGTRVNTIWGELAWQLGGAEAFAIVAEADRDRTPPGEALHRLLDEYSPALILIDEWVAYARTLVGRDDLAAGTFDDQFTFAQSLTEVVKATPGAMLAISIPASESGDDSDKIAAGNAEEVGGTNGLEALRRLQNVVRRVADQWRPASPDEAYHIVRQRLFQPADAKALASIAAAAERFSDLYLKHSGEFPSESRKPDYRERIKQTYPIHPELFDRLYEDWSSLERFQRTRGVLRLMNTVIHALWEGGDASPLIMPASVPLATADVNAELTQYLPDSWKAIIDADVDGPNSEPTRIDNEKRLFGARSVTKRLARAVFMGAAPTVHSAQKGITAQRVFLATATPGDTVGNFHSALNQLSDRTTYFYSGSNRYWYDLQPNITRTAKDNSDRVHKEDVWAEISRRLDSQSKSRGAFAGVHVCPEESSDIRDEDEARLVILHPKLSHRRDSKNSSALEFALKATENRGGASRTYRNMVVFLAPDEVRLEELDAAVRGYLGWKEVLDRQADLNLSVNQIRQAEEKMVSESEKAESRLLQAYQWALVPDGQPITMRTLKVEGQSSSLAERATKRLENEAELATQHAGSNIGMQLNGQAKTLWDKGHVSVKDLWNTYAQYPYMPRLVNSKVLREGLLIAPVLWQEDGYALAAGYDEENHRYRGMVLPTDDQWGEPVSEQDLIVRPEVALKQRAEDEAKTRSGDEDGRSEEASPGESDPVPGPGTGSAPVPDPPTPAPLKTRYFGSKQLSADRYALDFKQITDEVLAHLAANPGAEVKVTVEIEATSSEGFDDKSSRTVSENASTLKFSQSGFEV